MADREEIEPEGSKSVSRERSSFEGDEEKRYEDRDVRREESFAESKPLPKKGKAGKKARPRKKGIPEGFDSSEVIKKAEEMVKKGGKSKGKKKAIKSEGPLRGEEDTSQQSVPKEFEVSDKNVTEDKEIEVIENVDNKLIQEAQETEKDSLKEAIVDLDQNQDERRGSSGDEKKDSEKEHTSDEETKQVEIANVSGKDEPEIAGMEEIRRRATLSELRGTSIDGLL